MEKPMIVRHRPARQFANGLIAIVVLLTMPRFIRAADISAKVADQPEARVFTDSAGTKMPYLLLKPKGFEPTKAYPLVLFYRERGDDNHSQWRNGVEVFQLRENREKFPCFVIAPQCPVKKQWVNVPWG